MSSDGTQTPSSPPRPPGRDARTGVRTAEGGAPRQAPGPGAEGDGPSPDRAPDQRVPDTQTGDGSGGPSVGDRIKRAAQGAAGAARNALPSGNHDTSTTRDDTTTREWSPAGRPGPARPAATPRPAGDRPGTGRQASSPRPADSSERSAAGAARPAPAGPRRVRLAVARIDPWSVMKLAFLLSVAIGIMIVVAAAVVWFTLDELHVFTQVNDVIATLAGSETFFNLLEFTSFERVVALATMIALVDIVLLTALSTIGAFLYNIVAALVGGIHLTLTDD